MCVDADGKLDATPQVELAQNLADVPFGRRRHHSQHGADLGVGPALRHQGRDILLASGQMPGEVIGHERP
jgi:hypothetical protein